MQDCGHEVEAPADIARCLFDIGAEAPPEPEQFEIQLLDAGRSDDSPVFPTLAVTDVDCSGAVVVTSSTTTSTLVGCSTGVCEEDEACIDGECVATNRFEMEVAVTDDLHFGALQLEIRYDAGDGAFVGVGQDVACEWNPTIDGIRAFNHIVDRHPEVDPPILIVAIGSVFGFRTPPWLVRCLFEATSGAPTPETFAIDVVDASDPKTNPLHPTVVISRIRPVAPD